MISLTFSTLHECNSKCNISNTRPACSIATAVTDDRSVVIRWRKSETSGQAGQSWVNYVTTQVPSATHHTVILTITREIQDTTSEILQARVGYL